jgi:hypothetical protein
MALLAGLALSIVLIGLGIHRRWRKKVPVDSAYTSKLVWVSLGLGTSLGTLVPPAIWLLISYSIYGGRLEDNLPPGTDPKVLVGLLVVGTFMTMVYTVFGYRDHVFPYQVVSGLGSSREGRDATPITLGPEDRPQSESS